MAEEHQKQTLVDNAVAEGGAYEVISKRLVEQGKQLEQKTKTLNDSRLEEFGSSGMDVIARVRVRTENNCIARDIVQVGDALLFGYNVFIGLKKETKVEDVFALFRLDEEEGEYQLNSLDYAGSFLSEPSFVSDFDELYRYYKHTRLTQLLVKDGKLLAGFQIGERLEDIRVFRWSISADGTEIKYIDNRGERDIQPPPAYSFEWVETTREDISHGKNPHVNILDTVFVETINGYLTIKVEDNTQDGLGIYQEPVEDKTQSLDDADFAYAEVGDLILLSVLPYKEQQTRFFVFNKLTEEVLRIDAIGESCVELPEDHGVIFPGGYYLQTGEYKTFDEHIEGLQFRRALRSPNGEDMLFVFFEPEEGLLGLFSYNLIEKSLENPIYGHGYARGEDGKIIIFNAEEEPTRIHPMQIWQTPFVSDEFASQAPASKTFFGKIGNAELVRGVSDIYSICRIISNQSVSLRLYEELNKQASKIFDSHHWIDSDNCRDIATLLKQVSSTAELVVDEFEKVESIRRQSAKQMADAETEQKAVLSSIRPDSWETAEQFVNALSALRRQRGHLTTIKELRYIDVSRVDELDLQVQQADEKLSAKTVEFLSDEQSLSPYHDKITDIASRIEEVKTNAELAPLVDTVEEMALGLDLLSELMATLQVDDATLRTRIIDAISEVYAKLNQTKANAKHKQKNLGSSEAVAQFSAQFKLLSQSITNALGLSTTPEKCDEQLSRLLVQLEELESQFSDFDQFLADIMEKREEIYESFESHKQQLLDERQRKAQNIVDAASRILASIQKRSLKFAEADELNTYFVSDALVLKARELAEQLRELGDPVKADDVDARFKAIKEQAIRSLRDKTDIYEEGGNIIKLGPRHKFSVNNQELDLTIIPRDGDLYLHLSGTDYYERIESDELSALKAYWDMSLESETDNVYRGEYLASLIIDCAVNNVDLSIEKLSLAATNDDDQLMEIVRDFASPRYKEGYERGVHDHDAAKILKSLLPTYNSAGLLRFDPEARALAQVFWANIELIELQEQLPAYSTWIERAQSGKQMQTEFGSSQGLSLVAKDIEKALYFFIDLHPFDGVDTLTIETATQYLVLELAQAHLSFVTSKYAKQLVDSFKSIISEESKKRFSHSLEKLQGWPAERWQLTRSWLEAFVKEKSLTHLEHYIPEAIAILNTETSISRTVTEADVEVQVKGLLGDHQLIENQELSFSLDDFLSRMEQHKQTVIPQFKQYHQVRSNIVDLERAKLRLHEFKPRPLSSFVRNRLINESYLPIIGDNLAKQMGTVGDNKRTDLMGLLMMISPPGYGKTTLMEYVASRLGLIFMKINCPSLGHDVMSLDSEQAPNATARQELEKLNLALEMGNNVMLYLDDIQHTHPEFLQKFISLCDGTRRIEGIWKGNSKTYDMRGKKFCVVMAGNPYTESGEAFKVPDMLANRADIYNLGDILGGMEEQFSLSYIENSLTSNPVLAPLALRDMEDSYKLFDMAKGKNIATTDLKHQYSGAEINEITSVLKKMFVIQDVILKINQQYIASAAQDDKYRTEPAFKLQGSYRNMNKMGEKISAVMNDKELIQLIDDHYLGESQLLTTGAEANLLKLAELRGTLSGEQLQRWQSIKKDFMRNKAMGGDEADTGNKVVAQLVDLSGHLQTLNSTAEAFYRGTSDAAASDKLYEQIAAIVAGVQSLAVIGESIVGQKQQATVPANELVLSKEALQQLVDVSESKIQVINQPVPGIESLLKAVADTIDNTVAPMIKTLDKKIDIDLDNYEKLKGISRQLRSLHKAD